MINDLLNEKGEEFTNKLNDYTYITNRSYTHIFNYFKEKYKGVHGTIDKIKVKINFIKNVYSLRPI